MYDLFKPAFLALILVGGTATAQETDTAAETETPTEQAEPAPGPSDLSLGEPVDGQAPVVPTTAEEVELGQPYVPTFFGDWALRCLNAGPEQADPCQLYQLLFDEQQNAVAEFSLFPLEPGGQAAAGATIVVPLETLLTQQLTMSVDGGASRRYPFTFCNAGGCVARVGFTQEEVNQFKRGNSAQLRLVPAAAPEEEVLLTVSLSGFTAALESTR